MNAEIATMDAPAHSADLGIAFTRPSDCQTGHSAFYKIGNVEYAIVADSGVPNVYADETTASAVASFWLALHGQDETRKASGSPRKPSKKAKG